MFEYGLVEHSEHNVSIHDRQVNKFRGWNPWSCALRGGGVKVQGCQITMSLSIPGICCTKSMDNHWADSFCHSAPSTVRSVSFQIRKCLGRCLYRCLRYRSDKSWGSGCDWRQWRESRKRSDNAFNPIEINADPLWSIRIHDDPSRSIDTTCYVLW